MENYQSQHIKQNLSKLVSQTTLETGVLLYLVSKGILVEEDCQLLDSIQIPLKKTEKFYWMIQTRPNSYEPLIEALEKTRQSETANILRRIFLLSTSGQVLSNEQKDKNSEQQTQADKPIFFDVRAPVRLFTGREHEVAELRKNIMSSGDTNATVISQMASITGLGGIGKTELCRRYIQKHKGDFNGNVIWINAEKEDVICASFIRLSKDVLKISTKDANGEDKNIKTVVDDVYDYFKDRKSLFVFDNAETGVHLQKYLPLHITDGPYILITSRDRDWKFSVGVFELDVLSEQDAKVFVKNGLNINDASQDEEILKLVKTLQNFPLAIQQAVSFINERKRVEKYDVAKYLKAFERNSEKVLDSKIPTSELSDYTKTTFTAWKMTTVSISLEPDFGQMAIKILNLISYFEPENIQTQIFSKLLPRVKKNDWKHALQLLVRYSMVNIRTEEDEKVINIHRLVQEVTRIELKRRNMEEEIIREALKLLEDLNQTSVIHAITVFEFAFKHASIILEHSELPSKIIDKLLGQCRLHEAKSFGRKSLKNLQQFSSIPLVFNALEFKVAFVDFKLYNFESCLKSFKNCLRRYCKEFDSILIKKLSLIGSSTPS